MGNIWGFPKLGLPLAIAAWFRGKSTIVRNGWIVGAPMTSWKPPDMEVCWEIIYKWWEFPTCHGWENQWQPCEPCAAWRMMVNHWPSGLMGLSFRHKLSGWWLGHPSEKYESQLGWWFPIYGKIKNVPNHQPALVLVYPADLQPILYEESLLKWSQGVSSRNVFWWLQNAEANGIPQNGSCLLFSPGCWSCWLNGLYYHDITITSPISPLYIRYQLPITITSLLPIAICKITTIHNYYYYS